MATKKEYTLEELKEQYAALAKQIKDKEAEEKAKLEAEKEARYKEVLDAYENFEELRSKFVDDYGSFTFTHKSSDENLCEWMLKSLGLI